jgi:hypothetical protein
VGSAMEVLRSVYTTLTVCEGFDEGVAGLPVAECWRVVAMAGPGEGAARASPHGRGAWLDRSYRRGRKRPPWTPADCSGDWAPITGAPNFLIRRSLHLGKQAQHSTWDAGQEPGFRKAIPPILPFTLLRGALRGG